MLLVGVMVTPAWADEPKPLTAEQRERLKERDRLAAEAQQLGQQGKLAEMVAAWQKKIAIEREVLGDAHEQVAASLAELANMQEFRRDFDAARQARRELLTLTTKRYGAKDWRVTDARLDLEDVGLRARLDADGRRRLQEALAMNQQVFQLWQAGRSREALPLAQKALAIRRELLGENNRAVAMSLYNLAAQYEALIEYGEAERLYLQARDLRKKLLGEDHPDYAASLETLGGLYQAMGDYGKAVPLLEQARDLTKRKLAWIPIETSRPNTSGRAGGR
jgi:hypothetical protein